MFELFIALFGGLFYCGKTLNEKARSKEFDRDMKCRNDTMANIRDKYAADDELTQQTKKIITSGKHFEDICNWLAEDLEYVFGDDWKKKLNLSAPFIETHIPSSHEMWVYHLLLAKKGKIDFWVVTQGFPIGGIDEKDMNIKFAECIERRLIEAGVQGVRLVFELDNLCYGRRRTAEELSGGYIKIESTCYYPTHRLW